MDKTKEVYKTIKRSISVTALFGGSALNNQSSTSHAPNKWIHSPALLINGRVEYGLKLLGHKEVPEPKGTHIVRDAIHAIRFQLQLNRSMVGHSSSKLQRVIIQISIDGVNILDYKTRIVLFKHQLHQISFCADDKKDKRVFSYIAKNDSSNNECFVFLSDKLAEEITLTVGEAFDLAYERFIKLRNFDDHKQIIALRRRVAQLEVENRELKQKLFDQRPQLPTTPIPPAPNLQHLSYEGYNSNTPRNGAFRNSPDSTYNELLSLNDIFVKDQDNNPIQRNPSELFDDNFDPRAEESKPAIREGRKASADVGALMKRMDDLDERIAEISDVFRKGLSCGDTGDSGQDFDIYEGKEGNSTQKPV